LNVGPVTDFTYPYGDYNAAIIQLVINDGFSGAGATLDGTSNASTDPYQLPRFSLQNTTTFSQVKAMIDNALASHTWLILTFHQIDTSGTQYSTTPADFNQIVDYLSQNRVPMVTVDQGVAAINAAQQ
jgi:hypothetical protein